MRRDFTFLLVVLLLGLVLRLDLLIASRFSIDSDEAIVGLMAEHIREGQEWPVFYYGQAYMGSLEAIIAAGLFSITGPSSAALKAVPLFFSLLLILLIYALTLEAADKRAARIAALLMAVAPPALLVWSSMARGGFIEIIVIGALAFLLLLRVIKAERVSCLSVFWIGLVLGVGWWVNNQILYFMLPVAAVLSGVIIWSPRSRWQARLTTLISVGSSGLLGFFLGGFPYWSWNFQNNWQSLEMFSAGSGKDVLSHFQGLLSTALPIILGGMRFWQANESFPGSILLTVALYTVLLAGLIALRRRQITRMLILKFDSQRCIELFLLFLMTCMFIFTISSFGWLAQAPRYLLPMYVGLTVLSGFVLSNFWNRHILFSSAILCLLLASNLMSTYWAGRAVSGEPIVYNGERVSRDHTELIAWLDKHEHRWVRTNYWIGYRLAFETKERVRFIVNQEPNQTRIAEWPLLAKDIDPDSMPLITVPAQAKIIRKALEILDYKYQEEILSGYIVFHSITAPYRDLKLFPNSLLEASANMNGASASLAIDGDSDSRWGSGAAQRPGMEFSLVFKKPALVRALEYDLGRWPHDYPRGMQIEFEDDQGNRTLYFDSTGWQAIRYYLEMRSRLTFYFKPQKLKKIILTETKQHPVFDWSIAEIKVFQ